MDPSALVLFSEATLSLYPILIRTLPTTLFTQWFARFLTFPVLAYLLSSPRDIPSLSTLLLRPSTLFAGLLNLVHIGASYVSFSLLPAGVALSLFYTYPLFNVLAGSLVFGEPLSFFTLILLVLALFGVWLLSREQATPASPTPPSTPAPPTLLPSSLSPSITGIIAALIAALTETLLYVFVRWTAVKEASNPFTVILQLYPIGLMVLLAFMAMNPTPLDLLDLRPRILLPLFAFNALIGFIGYATRFYTIPKVSTLVFSLLSFVGVLFGYLWGHWFTSDTITLHSLLGSGLIVVSAFLARYQNQK